MRKAIYALALLAVAGAVSAAPMTLIAHNQRSSSGTLSTLIWDGSNATTTPGMAVSAMASTATWDWDGSVMTSSGFFQTTSHVSSMASLSSVISDVTVDMVIDTTANTTGATSYECREGNFLMGVGAHGCANVTLGSNGMYDGAIAYNVGGDANCINRTVGGDDTSTGSPRGLSTPGSGGSCDTQAGAFDLWTVVLDEGPGCEPNGPPCDGGEVILSNGIPLTSPGTNYMTWSYVVPVPAAVWLFGSALGLLGWIRRRVAANA
jgi:hypothetical protein